MVFFYLWFFTRNTGVVVFMANIRLFYESRAKTVSLGWWCSFSVGSDWTDWIWSWVILWQSCRGDVLGVFFLIRERKRCWMNAGVRRTLYGLVMREMKALIKYYNFFLVFINSPENYKLKIHFQLLRLYFFIGYEGGEGGKCWNF